MKLLKFSIFILALLTASALFIPHQVLGAPNATVTNCSNDTDLRIQLTSLQAAGGGTLNFNCGTTTIVLTNILPDIEKTTVIDGGDKIILSGNDTVPILHIRTDVAATLKNIVLEKGFSANVSGGAVLNEGFLTLDNADILDSHTSHDGGAIANFNRLEIKNSTLSNNSATNGGAVYSGEGLSSNPELKISASKFLDNSAAQDMSGGAILARTRIQVTTSEFVRNKAGLGGAIAFRFISGSAELSSIFLSENQAIGDEPQSRGGAFYIEDSTISVQNSRLESNEGQEGAGIYVHTNGKLTVTQTTFHNNLGGIGGGLLNRGNATLTNVALDKNAAIGGGGAIANESSLSVTNATFSGNEGLLAGGLMNVTGEASLTNVTFAENRSALASGGAISNEGATTLLTLKNVIVGKSVQSTNCLFVQPPFVSEFNLSSDNSCNFGAGRDNLDVKLAALTNNGGSTRTHLPLPGSPAIDSGDNSVCPDQDQRGVTRPQGAKCDVGAVEVGGTPPCTTKPDKPVLKKPAHNKPIAKTTAKLKWNNANCAEKFKVIIRLDSPRGASFQQKGKLTSPEFVTKSLVKGKTYYWRVVAINPRGKSKSDWRTFMAK